jgi:hypothetical protein
MAQHDSMITAVVMLVAQFSTCIPSPESPPQVRSGPGRPSCWVALWTPSRRRLPRAWSRMARLSLRLGCHDGTVTVPVAVASHGHRSDGHGGAPGHVDVRVTGTGTGALAILNPASEFYKSLIEPATAPKLGTYLAAAPGRASAVAGPLSAIMMVPMTPAGPGPRP